MPVTTVVCDISDSVTLFVILKNSTGLYSDKTLQLDMDVNVYVIWSNFVPLY
jgi:hypothetical protein